jgi:hypothetical protein
VEFSGNQKALLQYLSCVKQPLNEFMSKFTESFELDWLLDIDDTFANLNALKPAVLTKISNLADWLKQNYDYLGLNLKRFLLNIVYATNQNEISMWDIICLVL